MKSRKLGKRAFARALRHGLGSAFLHVKEFGDEGVEEILLNACLTNLVFDRQIDVGRARWLARILDLTGRIDDYANSIRAGFSENNVHSERDLEQLIELAAELFERGFGEFKQSLFSLMASKHNAYVTLGKALVEVSAWTGFAAAARMMVSEEFDRDDKFYFFEFVSEHFDNASCVKTFLQEESENDPLIAQFWCDVQEEIAERENRTSSGPRARGTLGQVLDAVENHPNPKSLHYFYRSFGRTASDSELEVVLRRLETEKEISRIFSYLAVFWSKPMPSVSKHIINMLNSSDPDLRRGARNALSNVRDMRIRKAGLRLIASQDDELVVSGLKLLELNLEARDISHVDVALRRLEGIDWVHWGAMSATKIAGNTGNVGLSETLAWVCEFTPCGHCRRSAMQQLINWSNAPERLLYEAQWDAEPGVRELSRAASRFGATASG